MCLIAENAEFQKKQNAKSKGKIQALEFARKENRAKDLRIIAREWLKQLIMASFHTKYMNVGLNTYSTSNMTDKIT